MIDNKIVWLHFEDLMYQGDLYTLTLGEVSRKVRPRLLYQIKKNGHPLKGFGVDNSEDNEILSLKNIIESRMAHLVR